MNNYRSNTNFIMLNVFKFIFLLNVIFLMARFYIKIVIKIIDNVTNQNNN